MRPFIGIHVITALVNLPTTDGGNVLYVGNISDHSHQTITLLAQLFTTKKGMKTHDAYSFNVSKRSLII